MVINPELVSGIERQTLVESYEINYVPACVHSVIDLDGHFPGRKHKFTHIAKNRDRQDDEEY